MGADAGRGGQADRYWHTLLAPSRASVSVANQRSVPVPRHAALRCQAGSETSAGSSGCMRIRAISWYKRRPFCRAGKSLVAGRKFLAATLGVVARGQANASVDGTAAFGTNDLHGKETYLSPNILSNRPVAPMLLPYVFRLTTRFA
jgi:hypothetical protein